MNGVLLFRLLLTTSVVTAPAAAHAQAADEASAASAEIIVTAQKRSERLIDVPLSITAASGEQLAKAGVVSALDLGKVVPGFTYQPSNYGPPVFSIRGIGFFDNTLAATPTVTAYVDQVPLPYIAMTPGATLDLERVEVLKGPQGTLFGQNSTGGAINFIAAKPTKELSFGGSVEYARFDQVSVGGFISGPLSDALGVRLAARTEQGGAWQKSLTRPGDKLGDRDFTAGRLILDWNPDDVARFEFSANGWLDKSETQASQYLGYAPTRPPPAGYTDQEAPLLAAPLAPRNNRSADWDANADLKRDSEFYQFSLRGEFDLSDMATLTTITAYSNLDYENPIDTDGTAFRNYLTTVVGKIESFSQEIRLAGDSGKLKWMIGGNYGYDDSMERSNLRFTASNSGVGPFRYDSIFTNNNVTAETISVFGSLDYQLTDTLLAQASARYTDSQREGKACLQDTGDGNLARAFSVLSARPLLPGECVTFAGPLPAAPPFTPVGGFATESLPEDNLSWRANLSWKPNGDVHLYANITRGYKAGSFSILPLVSSSQYEPVPQESVLAYEAGFKLSALDRTLQLSGAAFYYDYSDKQILGFIPTLFFGTLPGLVTVPKSRVIGAELNLNWRPIEGLTLNGGVTHLDSKVTESFTTKDPFGVDIDIKGFSFPITPKWQASGDAEYSFPLSGNLDAYVGTNITYRSKTPATFGGDARFILPAYTLVDLRAGIEVDGGKWRAEIWGRNVFDTFYTVSSTHVIDTVNRITGRPATYGVTLSTRF